MIKRLAAITSLCLITLLTAVTKAGFSEPMTFPLPPGSVEGDNFGFSIAADGDTAVVTSYSYPNRDSIETNGAAYVYTFDGSAWSFQQELIPVDPDPYENYGWDADVSGDTIVVSAASNSGGSETVPGKVFVFTRTNNTWTQTQILVEPRQVTNAQVYNDRYDGFAESVAIDGDRIAVGHPYYNYFITITDPNGSSMEYESTSSGAVFVYDRSDNFTTSTILSGGLPEDDFFNIGYSVDVAGDTIIASANAYSVEAGMAYIFKDTGNSYTTQKLLPAVSGNNGRITGTVAIGTYKDSSGQSSRIVAVITYDGLDNDILLELYVQNGDTWILTTQFDGPAPESGFVDQEWVFQHMVFGDNVLFAGGIEYGAGSAIFPILINPDGTGTHTAPFRTYVGALAATDTQLLYGTTGNFNILFEHEQEPPGTGARSRFYDYPAPSVTSITPVSGTLNVPPDTLLGATFSEPVTTTDDYGQLYCANSREFFRFTPPLTNVTEFTIGPPDFFQPGEYCQFTLFGDAFTDGVNGLDADDNGTGGDNAGGYFNVAVAAPDGGDVSAGTFVNSGQFLGIRQSADVELGDIDNDGDLDAVVINYENPTRLYSGLDEIWLNDGSGAFTLFSTLTFNDDPMFSDGVEDISLVDINNDGNLDIATGTGVVRPGNGDGTFGDVIEILVNGNRQYNDPSNVFADINGDGLLDYVGGSVPLGNGDFTFSRAPEPGGYWGQYASMQTTTDIELGDFNNDGNIDILGAYSDRIVVYLTDGTPYLFTDDTFGTAAPVTTYTEIAVADLNGDANLDVVLSGGTLSFGNGDGTFSDSVELPDRSSVFRYIPGDLDGDGDMDLVGASSTGDNPVYKNDGSGGFTRDPDIVTVGWTSDVAIGDLDGDGDLDAFFAANGSADPRDPKNASTVWLNRQTPVDIRKPGIVYTDTESSSKHSCSEIGMRDALSLADYSTEPATITFEPGCTTIDVTQPLLMQFDSLSIDGGGTVTFDGGGTSRLFFVYGARPLTLRGVTLQNAYSDEDGAAITVLSGDFVIEDSVLRDNVSVSGGGAIRNSGVDWWTKGELTIHNTQFINNASSGDGGAIRNYGDLQITDSLFENNRSEQSGGAIAGDVNSGTIAISRTTFRQNSASSGGALQVPSATWNVSDSTFSENTGLNGGGAINARGAITITGSIFELNQSAAGQGGAIRNFSTTTVRNTTLTDNSAVEGGAIANIQGQLTIDGSTFNGNTVDSENGTGSALYNIADFHTPQVTMYNSTLTGNTTLSGATVANHGGAVAILTNTTLSGNTGIGIDNTDSTLTLNNNILANNSDVSGSPQPDCTSPGSGTVIFSPGTSNLIDLDFAGSPCGTAGVNYISANPSFTPLAENGGTVQTLLPEPDSPIIDAGVNDAARDEESAALTVDARGEDRISGTNVDLGAIEVQPSDVLEDTTPPQVSEITPAEPAPVDSNIVVTFTEPVTVEDGWFTITCPTGETRINTTNAVVSTSNEGNAYSIDPDFNLPPQDTCTLTVVAAVVSDTEQNTMSEDYGISFTTGEPIYDLNEDGLISQSDAIAVINQIGQPKDINNAVTDVDGNGIIEEADANAVIALIGTVVNE